MKTPSTTTIVTYGVMILAAGASFMLPNQLELPQAYAGGSPDVIRLRGVVRDFQSSHPDFDAGPSEAPGHVVGLVDYKIGADGTPMFDGAGNRVLSEAKSSSGHNIAPVLANAGKAKGVNFTINNGKVIPSEAFVAKLTVIGAAMETPYAGMRVTTRLKVGTTTVEPFGPLNNSATGNVHDGNNPRHYVMSTPMAAGTAMSVTGKSYFSFNGSPWTALVTTDSATSGNNWVKVLKNGDSVPNIQPFASQASIATFLKPYINTATQKVTIADNQAIFLFELATSDNSKPYCDFQDLVTIITMAKGPEAFAPGMDEVPNCGPTNDSAASLDPTSTTAGIGSASSFGAWFNDTLGVNMACPRSLDLMRQNDGTYLFDDKLDPHYAKLGGFFPADGRLMGDKDESGHNENFTYQFEAMFKYHSSMNQFFETMSDAEIWVFINDELVIDLGGFHGALNQRIDLSRLCLQEGKEYKLSFFMASRYAPQSSLRISTNIEFDGAEIISASALGD